MLALNCMELGVMDSLHSFSLQLEQLGLCVTFDLP